MNPVHIARTHKALRQTLSKYAVKKAEQGLIIISVA